MKNFILAIIITLFASMTANAQEETLKRYELDVADFTELKVVHSINVRYVNNPDSAGRAVFIAPDKHVSIFMFNNTKNRLEIQIATDDVNLTNAPTITVYSKFLSKVENSGDSTVTLVSVAPTPKFNARLIGNGRIVAHDLDITELNASLSTGNGQLILFGKCKNAKLSCTGTGSVQADDLVANEVNCRMLGTGTIGCQAIDKLSISGISSGKVYYKGNPQEIKRRSVGVKIIPLDNEQ